MAVSRYSNEFNGDRHDYVKRWRESLRAQDVKLDDSRRSKLTDRKIDHVL
jgi:hypothetical protein